MEWLFNLYVQRCCCAVQNGLLSGVPYLAMWIFMILSGFVADILRTKNLLQTTNIRKLCNGVGKPRDRLSRYSKPLM